MAGIEHMTDSNSDKESGEKCGILASDRAEKLGKDAGTDDRDDDDE